MDTQMFFDPILFGPGMWYQIHTDSLLCNTFNLKYHFMARMNLLCDNFKCDECKIHFKKFIDTHPIQNYFNMLDPVLKKDIGMFKWTWEFHNDVNRRLEKYQPTFEEAYQFYSNQILSFTEKSPKDPPKGPVLPNKYVRPVRTCNSCNRNKMLI